MKETHVVTCFLENKAKILFLCRSGQVGSYTQRWAGISGYIEPGHSPLEQALQEIGEETGLSKNEVKLLKEGLPLEVIDETLGKIWVVHPFRFQVDNPEKIQIDWEHSEYRWIEPEEIKNYNTVPGLYSAWERVK
jgi:8-oxo-dGTP diphosphatase